MAGAVKYDAGKPRLDLIPFDVLLSVGEVFAIGAKKYSPRNWELGMEYGRVVRALMSHLSKWMMGEERDAEDGQHHLDSVVWCAMVLRAYTLRNIGVDDRFPSIKAAEVAHPDRVPEAEGSGIAPEMFFGPGSHRARG